MSEGLKTQTFKKQHLIDNLVFLGISFNGITSIEYDQNDSPSSMIVKRLFYSEFVDVSKVSYGRFNLLVKQLIDRDGLNEGILFEWLSYLLKIKFPGKTFILLVDELLKLDKVSTTTTSQVRSLLCRLADDEPSLGLLFVVFSTLRLDVMEAEVRASGRKLIAITKLPLLSISDASAMLGQAVKEECTFEDGTRDGFVNTLAEISGGHPRTVEYMRNVIEANDCDPLPLSKVVYDAEHQLRSTYPNNPEIPLSLVETALLGDRVKLSDRAVGSKTYEDLIADGLLIGNEDSSSKNDYAPVLPEIVLYAVAQKFQRLRDMRTFMMFDRYRMDSLSFEEFHVRWEQLRRSLMQQRNGAAADSNQSHKKLTAIYGYNADDYYSASLKEVVVEDSPAPLMIIQATFEDFTYFIQEKRYTTVNRNSRLCLEKDMPGRLFRFPKDHPGSEFFITYEMAVDENKKDILHVHVQNKRSDESSNLKISKMDIDVAWNHIKTFEREVLGNTDESKIVLVLIANRGVNDNCYSALKVSALKGNIILLEENPQKPNRNALSQMYGSQFENLLDDVRKLAKDIKMLPPDYYQPDQSAKDV